MAFRARLLFAFIASLIFVNGCALPCRSADPTDGFSPVKLNDKNLVVQKPYDKLLQDRYSFVDGVHRLWVYSTDKPFKLGSSTKPRTEIRIKGYDYSSGVWQFEGYDFVPNGTTGASIMQIHRSNGEKPATDLMLMVFDGQLRFYFNTVVERDIYNRWMRINVIHDVEANMLTVFIDGVQKLTVNGGGVSDFYFKFGVYEQQDESNYMESRWKDVRVYKKDGSEEKYHKPD